MKEHIPFFACKIRRSITRTTIQHQVKHKINWRSCPFASHKLTLCCVVASCDYRLGYFKAKFVTFKRRLSLLEIIFIFHEKFAVKMVRKKTYFKSFFKKFENWKVFSVFISREMKILIFCFKSRMLKFRAILIAWFFFFLKWWESVINYHRYFLFYKYFCDMRISRICFITFFRKFTAKFWDWY